MIDIWKKLNENIIVYVYEFDKLYIEGKFLFIKMNVSWMSNEELVVIFDEIKFFYINFLKVDVDIVLKGS